MRFIRDFLRPYLSYEGIISQSPAYPSDVVTHGSVAVTHEGVVVTYNA